MTGRNFIGTGVALITPFKEDYQVDYHSLAKLLKHTTQNNKGVDYWVVQGTTGETTTLQPDEKRKVLDFVQSNNSQNLPIMLGIGGNHTQEVVETIQKTDFQGVDAILSVSPYYNKPSQEGIYQHYLKIAEASPIPVMLYNVPGRTGSNITAETTLRLAEHPNIIGTKEASGNLVQCMEIAKHKPADFLLISGDDLLTVPLIALGGEGVISVLANAFPNIFYEMTHSALKGDFKTANHYLHKLLEINPLMYEESNPVGVKQVLEVLEICKNQVRLPLVTASESLKNKIQKALPAITMMLDEVID
jgi:4-hydroxy-tetrahydrodipicolinate synthase